jgi:hypothetical protein
MVLLEDGQSRMRVEGLPVEVGLVISVNEIWTEDVVVAVVAAGFAVFVVSLFKDKTVNETELGVVEVCVCVANAALVR